MNRTDSTPPQDPEPLEKKPAKDAYLKMASILDEKLTLIYQKLSTEKNPE